MIDESLFDELLSSVPKNIQSLISETNIELSDLKKEILRKHRIICLLPYFLLSQELPLAHFPDMDHTLNLFQPKEITAFVGLSLISQNTSFLIHNLQMNPVIFAETIVKNTKIPNYQYFLRVIIPSIYGYFSSYEHMNFANCFYLAIIDIADPEIAIPIVVPFLTAPITYRYIEYTLTEFFTDMDWDQSLDSRNKNSSLLLEYLTRGIPLLPEQILQLFRQIKSKNWRSHFLAELFLVNFVFPNVLRWSKAHFMNDKIPQVKKMLSNVGQFKDGLKSLYQTLCTARSLFQPPFMYHCFNQPSISYYLVIHDIQLLAEFLDTQKLLPSCVEIDIYRKVPLNFQFINFWCYVYPSHHQVKEPPTMRLVFPQIQVNERTNPEFQRRFRSLQSLADNSNKFNFVLQNSGNSEFYDYSRNQCCFQLKKLADSFEIFMDTLRLHKEMVKWNNLVTSNQIFLYLSHLTSLKQWPFILNILPRKVQFLYYLSNFDESSFQDSFDKITKLSTDWDFYIHQKIESTITDSLPISFFSTLSLFSSIAQSSLPEKFVQIMKVLEQIELFAPQNDDALYFLLIQNVPGRVLLNTYVEINVIAIRDAEASQYCTKTQKIRWQRFEKLIYESAKDNKDLTSQLIGQQNKFQEIFVRCKRPLLIQ
ncbi:hypothetical protein TRFO_13014 [Tritrichomonas foetus]|uniref:Uncharacterized protein n=1 Tax=Tritrichomonas foetus TaxID=1144522 RepID=A0A1J4L467_9EUKA|nr:hypothetical protein TRFO_13014 [Tritrichomonas foetus]|eukprot:OHT16742.1 hypothetical protein TRFO_13014 [Tritrichomonas foetus]